MFTKGLLGVSDLLDTAMLYDVGTDICHASHHHFQDILDCCRHSIDHCHLGKTIQEANLFWTIKAFDIWECSHPKRCVDISIRQLLKHLHISIFRHPLLYVSLFGSKELASNMLFFFKCPPDYECASPVIFSTLCKSNSWPSQVGWHHEPNTNRFLVMVEDTVLLQHLLLCRTFPKTSELSIACWSACLLSCTGWPVHSYQGSSWTFREQSTNSTTCMTAAWPPSPSQMLRHWGL